MRHAASVSLGSFETFAVSRFNVGNGESASYRRFFAVLLVLISQDSYRSGSISETFDHRANGGLELKQASDHNKACEKVDLPEVNTPDRRSQVDLSVADMPDGLGELLDRGIEDLFRDH